MNYKHDHSANWCCTSDICDTSSHLCNQTGKKEANRTKAKLPKVKATLLGTLILSELVFPYVQSLNGHRERYILKLMRKCLASNLIYYPCKPFLKEYMVSSLKSSSIQHDDNRSHPCSNQLYAHRGEKNRTCFIFGEPAKSQPQLLAKTSERLTPPVDFKPANKVLCASHPALYTQRWQGVLQSVANS